MGALPLVNAGLARVHEEASAGPQRDLREGTGTIWGLDALRESASCCAPTNELASPGMASWNQLLGWLREMNELRLALAEKAA